MAKQNFLSGGYYGKLGMTVEPMLFHIIHERLRSRQTAGNLATAFFTRKSVCN